MDWLHVRVILVFKDGSGDEKESRWINASKDPWTNSLNLFETSEYSEKSLFLTFINFIVEQHPKHLAFSELNFKLEF